ncbi:MAG: ATP-binding protein, partial [Candidatus Kapabacteria bacterium]|nr:ATP-binding protein [Candidatus Kapabacteria bacterium]
EAYAVSIKMGYLKGQAHSCSNLATAFHKSGNIDSAVYYYDRAIELYNMDENPIGVAKTYRIYADMFLDKYQYANAIQKYFSSLDIYHSLNDNENSAILYSQIGWLFRLVNDFDTARKYILKGISYLETCTNSKELAEAHIRFALILSSNKEFDSALQHLKEAEQVAIQSNNIEVLIRVNQTIGICYLDKKEYEQAINYYEKAINIAYRENIVIHIGDIYTLLAHVYDIKGDIEKNFLYNFKALNIRKEFGDNRLVSSSMTNIADLYIQIKKYDSAKYYLNDALTITININHQYYMSRNYMMLSKVAEAEGHFQTALDYRIKFNDAKYKIRAGIEDRSIQKLRIQFEDQIREKEKLVLIREKQFETYMYLSILIIMLLIILSVILGYIFKKRSNEKLLLEVERRTVELGESNAHLAAVIKSKIEFATKLSANKNELASVFAVMNDKIFVFDRETVFLKVAPTNNEQLLLPAEQLLGKRIEELFPDDDMKIVIESIQTCIDEHSVQNIIYSISPNDEQLWYNALIAPLGDGRAIFVARDITELKKAENEIVVLNLMLEAKVRERSDELKATLSKLEAENEERLLIENRLRGINADKNKFFSIIADDLKVPFAALADSAELLMKYIDLNDYESINKRIGLLDSEINIVGNLLENLLTWSRTQIDNISFNPETININRFFQDYLNKTETNAELKGISILVNFSEDIRIIADKNMLDIVIRNILSNAVKFTPPKGMIFCTASAENSFVKIKIRDTGIGISSENLKRLFKIDSKYAAVGTSNEIGSGLGLIICKELIERNGGKIEVASTSGKGTVVSLYLPGA